MNLFSKIFVIFLIVLGFFYFKNNVVDNFLNSKIDNVKNGTNKKLPDEIEKNNKNNTEINKKTEKKVYSYFLKETQSGKVNFLAVENKVDNNAEDLKAAVENLLKGPSEENKKNGFYSEIPKGTKLLSLKETDKYIIINLNDEFQYGGGTDSIYNRLKQLIKTVSQVKVNKDIYLYLNGKQADVIGGEGIIIKQPLTQESLYSE